MFSIICLYDKNILNTNKQKIFSSLFSSKHLVTPLNSNKIVGNHFRETLSMRELDGFFWKAVLASVLRARNSRTSSLLATSGMAQSFCKSVEKQGVRETRSRFLYKSHNLSFNGFISEGKSVTLRNDSSWLLLASTLSVSTLLKGSSRNSFFGPLTS